MGRSSVPINKWIASPLQVDVKRSVERLARAPGVVQLAIMPDVHLAQDVCVGVVVATKDVLIPAAVGGDIGCGMAAIAFDADAELLADETAAARLLATLGHAIPTSRHRRREQAPGLPAPLLEAPLTDKRLERTKRWVAEGQLGTLGSGNHFVEFQRDEQHRLWLMLHSGARGIGPAIRDHHLAAATGRPFPFLLADSELGRAYLADCRWAVAYAEANRQRMVERATEIITQLFGVSADWDTFFQCHHNHVQKEDHAGRQLWVHRKGALHADAGVRGMIPGSMGSLSYHVTGRGHHPALCSSSHGAGRVMSRGEARRRLTPEKLCQQMQGVFFDHRLASRLCDEAPSAYRDIGKVMRAQRQLTRIDRKLWPILSYKGG